MDKLMSVWEYRPETGDWWIYRSGYHQFHAEQLRDYLNANLQEWRKQKGVRYEIFPLGVNPNNKEAVS